MSLNKILKFLQIITLGGIFISIVLLFYYSSKSDVGLGIFVIGFIFISTMIYYIILNRVISYLLKKSGIIHILWIIVLIALNILPIIIHLWLLNLI